MYLLETLHKLIDGLGELPWIQDLRKSRYDKRFSTAERVNLFRGIYPDASTAAHSIPATKPSGYDNEAPAAMYEERTRQIYPGDYPVLFWLQKLLGESVSKVFDIGGHIGVGYYAYQKYLDYPVGLRWCVSDVPAVVARGQQLAEQWDKAGRLQFTSDLHAVNGYDLVLASGSIQYLPMTLGQLLGETQQKPPHVIVNLLPLHPEQTYFTVQNIGTAFCVYRIQSHLEFVAAMREAGYELVDAWENLEKKCEIPFSPAHYSLDRYYGFYFRSTTAASTK